MNSKKLNAPLYDMLKNYAEEKNRFHTPAHSGAIVDKFCDKSDTHLLYASAPFDITELSFSDNLNSPTGVIKKAEALMAEAYGVKESLFFTSGATTAIFTALCAIRTKTDKIAVDLFSHKSVFSACRFLNFEITIIARKFDDEGFPLPLCANDVLTALESDTQIKAVTVTSPDYFGNALDVEAIAKVVHSKNALLFVDEAHGSHFAFSSLLPPPATKFSDLTVNSLHKTLPVFTGGAVLNINCELSTQCALYRANFHTSSPSYVTLGSLDYARAVFQSDGEEMYQNLNFAIRSLINDNPRYDFKNTEYLLHDFSRLVIDVDACELECQNVFCDMSWGRYSVFICTPYNIDRIAILSKVLKKLSPTAKNEFAKQRGCELNTLEFPTKLMPFDRDCATEFVPLNNSIGRASAVDVGCYPPGVPVIFAGERITSDKINFLMRGENSIFNLVRDKICVIIEKVTQR